MSVCVFVCVYACVRVCVRVCVCVHVCDRVYNDDLIWEQTYVSAGTGNSRPQIRTYIISNASLMEQILSKRQLWDTLVVELHNKHTFCVCMTATQKQMVSLNTQTHRIQSIVTQSVTLHWPQLHSMPKQTSTEFRSKSWRGALTLHPSPEMMPAIGNDVTVQNKGITKCFKRQKAVRGPGNEATAQLHCSPAQLLCSPYFGRRSMHWSLWNMYLLSFYIYSHLQCRFLYTGLRCLRWEWQGNEAVPH